MNQSNKKIFIFLTGLLILMLPLSFYLKDEMPTLETTELVANPAPAASVGKIYGKVVDKKTNEPIAGANVVLVGTQMGAATDNKGNFVIIKVPQGAYQVQVSMMGFKQVMMENVRVSVGRTTQVDFKLEVAIIQMGTINAGDDTPPPPSPPKEREISAVRPVADGETPPPPPPPKSGDVSSVFVAYDKPPEPIGGMSAIQKKLVYPEKSRKEGREGIVDVKILIDEKGNVVEAENAGTRKYEAEKGPDQAMIDAAVKAVKETKWKPAEQRGRAVQVWIAVPIAFNLK